MANAYIRLVSAEQTSRSAETTIKSAKIFVETKKD
jgi:hypothetical protein